MKQPRSKYAAVGIRESKFSDSMWLSQSLRFRGIPTGLQYRRTYQIEGVSVEIAARSTVE